MESAAASAFLKSVMGRLFLVLEKEYNKHKGLAQATQSIQQDLRMIAAAMDDQLRTLGPNDRTAVARMYREEILDLAHDIEDCVDRFMHRLRCKQRSGGGGAGALVHRVAHELKKVQSRCSFADEIQKLKRRLKDAHQRVIDGGSISCGGQPGGLSSTAAYSKPSHVARNRPVGFEKPVEELLSLLDEVDGEPEQLRVISVVGFGGLGKTTLARAVYDSPQTKAKFDCRAWIAATGDSPKTRDGMRGILRDILQQVRPRDTMDFDSQHLEASLKEYLNDKRYLFVIDDIRLDEWSTVNSAFEDNSTSSRIILTTTIQSVANMCSHGNGYVYQMDTLGEEDSKKIAFPGVRSPELEQGSAALLGKCDGLPLALVSVSDYLKSSSEPTGELCAKLCRNLGSHLEEKHHGHDNFSDLRKVLLGNYDSLSGYALTCLLYLGIFPNNRPLKRKVVIRRWLAEGYARSDSLRSEQDIAEENFDKLIDKNIIHPVDTRNNSQAKTCKTHGIMHEFVRHKSLSQRFIATPSPDNPRPGIDANNARHLSIHCGELAECMESGVDLSRVRSLTVFGDADGVISYVHKCKLMRVLDLEECNVLEDHDLKHICRLWHLKYLSLGGTVCELPRCIEGLHCLGTLDLRRTRIKSLPIEVIQLPHLTQLFGKFMLDKDDLKNVNKMSKLQRFLSGKKSNLQTLAGFVTDDRNGFLQLMGDMNKLRKVKIWCRPAANSSNYIDDLSMAIQQFNKVSIDRDSDRSLSLVSEEPSENFLNSLVLEPCPEGFKYDLRSLKLHGKLPRLPPFVALLSGLTELCISSDTLTRDLLSAVVNLSRLLYLKLIADQLEHLEIKHGEFPSLRRLCFAVQSLTSAPPTIEQGALQNIVSLQLLCRGPIVLSGIKIRNFKYLKEITIDSKATAETRQHWEGSAKNHPNRPRVLLLETADPMESEEPGPCAMTEKRKRTVDQPSSDGGLDSSLKKMRLSEPSFFEVSRDHPSGGGNGAQCHHAIFQLLNTLINLVVSW
ncbi:disease resistance protein RGA4-like [Phragmites australis]|uniref:disease resistance protein RGA4-like n=1 Tax=Phragmites australis TaxID=29695 RepID=UPI002D77F4C8|nr:disease resistance protein RGA4-like [Phragmites australis]